MTLRVEGLGPGVEGWRFRVRGLGFLGFGFWSMVLGLGFGIEGLVSGFGIEGLVSVWD